MNLIQHTQKMREKLTDRYLLGNADYPYTHDVNLAEALNEIIRETLAWAEKKVVPEAREENEPSKEKRLRKPTHGTCCTCQKCGGDIDGCDCERNQIIERLVSIIKSI